MVLLLLSWELLGQSKVPLSDLTHERRLKFFEHICGFFRGLFVSLLHPPHLCLQLCPSAVGGPPPVEAILLLGALTRTRSKVHPRPFPSHLAHTLWAGRICGPLHVGVLLTLPPQSSRARCSCPYPGRVRVWHQGTHVSLPGVPSMAFLIPSCRMPALLRVCRAGERALSLEHDHTGITVSFRDSAYGDLFEIWLFK